MTRLNIIWRKQNISFPVKIKLYKSLVISVLLYGYESWTLNAETERRIQSFEFRCYRKLLGIKYTEHRTNSYVEQEIKAKAGKQEPLLSTVRRRKLAWFGHVTRHNNLAKTILQGSVHGQRKRGRPRKAWFDNIKEWTGQPLSNLLRTSESREEWRSVSAKASMVPLRH